MELDELYNLINAKKQNRNGVVNAGVYVPRNTKFSLYDDSGDTHRGYVRPLINHDMANLGTSSLTNQDSDGDLRSFLYTLFHESAHTAQPKQDMLGQQLGVGKYAGLKNNEFAEYDPNNKTPLPAEALASLRGYEAMMPSGNTVWDLHTLYPNDVATKATEKYVKDTRTNNPRLTERGAKKYIDLRMFPDHSLMHDSLDFIPSKKPPTNLQRGIDTLLRLLLRR